MRNNNHEYRLIFANFDGSFGGTLVISELCSILRNLGYDAKVLIKKYPKYGQSIGAIGTFLRSTRSKIRLILLRLGLSPEKFHLGVSSAMTIPGCKYKLFSWFNRNNTIVIYPENIWGNPLKAKNVVRWLLYHHKYYEGANTYSIDDIFIAYRSIFNDLKLNPNEDIIKINYFNKELYRQYNYSDRSGNCYIIRKGRDRSDLPTEFDGPVFDDNMSDEEFVKILNSCKFCYSYDLQTFYTKISAVCGCIPILVPEPGKTESDYYSNDEKHLGVAFGDSPEQIEYALSTRDELLKSLDYEQENITNAKRLIRLLESKFGKIRNFND